MGVRYRRIVLEVDNLDVNRMLRKDIKRKEGLSILLHLDVLRDRDWYVHLTVVRCEGNTVVDALAKLFVTGNYELIRYAYPLAEVDHMLHQDRVKLG
ncbi:hypothetical protein V6N13_016038 [Hibiscus sabdariffa]